MYPEQIFIIRLRQYLCQLINLDTASLNDPKVHPKNYLQIDLVTASIVAILCGGCGTELPVKSLRNGIWKYQHIGEFLEIHREFLQRFLTSLKIAPKNYGAIKKYLFRKIDLDKFADIFVDWTIEVSQCYSRIKPCTKEEIIAAYKVDTERPLIIAVYEWKEQNIKVERITDRMLSSIGKMNALDRLNKSKLNRQIAIVKRAEIDKIKKQELENKLRNYYYPYEKLEFTMNTSSKLSDNFMR